jgi:hypothetical protein
MRRPCLVTPLWPRDSQNETKHNLNKRPSSHSGPSKYWALLPAQDML